MEYTSNILVFTCGFNKYLFYTYFHLALIQCPGLEKLDVYSREHQRLSIEVKTVKFIECINKELQMDNISYNLKAFKGKLTEFR